MQNIIFCTQTIRRGWGAGLVFIFLTLSQFAFAQACDEQRWVTAWQAAPSDATLLFDPRDIWGTYFKTGPDQTYRVVFRPLGHGKTMRLRFSNRFGKRDLRIKAINVAKQTNGAAIDGNSIQPVLFNGKTSITIPAKQDMVSDAIAFQFNSDMKLSVSMAVIDKGPHTGHFTAGESSFVTAPRAGDKTNEINGESFGQKITRQHILIGMDAMAPAAISTVVALGDSLTDGYNPTRLETIGKDNRYPDFLKERIDTAGLPLFVANAGISGNRLFGKAVIFSGPPVTKRYVEDVIGQNSVSDVILFVGINDIGMDILKFLHPKELFQEMIDSYSNVIKAIQSQGIKVTQGTLIPAGGSENSSYSSPVASQIRKDVNEWIRTQSPADVIVDFDAAVRDPSNPDFVHPDYISSDGLHLSSAGYSKLADAIDLSKFKGSACK